LYTFFIIGNPARSCLLRKPCRITDPEYCEASLPAVCTQHYSGKPANKCRMLLARVFLK
jgi:hypothetical protein